MRLLIIMCLTLITGTCIMSCSGEDQTAIPEFIFGSYYGFCAGNCTQLYKAENGALYPDAEDRLDKPAGELRFSSDVLDAADYARAVSLYENLPQQLYSNTEDTYGIPDAYDQGGYLLAVRDGSGYRSWFIDTNIDALPIFLQDYIIELRDFLEDLRE